MRYVAGVDGGGSQTSVVVVDESGTIRGRGTSGCANHQIVGVDKAMQSISQALHEAQAAAGISEHQVEFVQYGLAGADRARDFGILRPALGDLPYGHFDVISDAWEGLRAGADNNVGVTLVCGSGTNAVGRNAKGTAVQVGGFGYTFGDAAGGYHLAHEAFRTAVRAFEQRTGPSLLTTLVPENLGYSSIQALYDHFLDTDAEVPLDLAIVVHKAAGAGDRASKNILREMGQELAYAALAVLSQLGGRDNNAYLPIILVGSVVQKGRSPDLMSALSETLDGKWPNGPIRILDVAPVFGAVLLAMDRMGMVSSSEMSLQFQLGGDHLHVE